MGRVLPDRGKSSSCCVQDTDNALLPQPATLSSQSLLTAAVIPPTECPLADLPRLVCYRWFPLSSAFI